MAADEIIVLGFKLWSQWNCFLGALGLLWSLPTVIGSWVGLRRPEHYGRDRDWIYPGICGQGLPKGCAGRGENPLLVPIMKRVA